MRKILSLLALLTASPALAENPGVITTGAITATHLAVFNNAWTIQDGGVNGIITSAANPCFAVGANGSTNPVLSANCSASSPVSGIQVVGGATTVGAVINEISSDTNGTGLNLTINAASASATGNGGGVAIVGGVGNSTGNGGTASLTGGAGSSTGSQGGAVSLTGGAGTGSGGTANSGGAVTIAGGGGGTSGPGGAVNINGGAATGSAKAGGTIALTAGNSKTTTTGGGITDTTGNGGTISAGGNETHTTGNGGSTSGNSGSYVWNVGTVVSGVKGTFNINADVQFGGGAPVASTCGSGAVASGGTDHKFQVTGITAATACTITFSQALGTGPACSFNDSAGTAVGISAISTTAVTVSMTALTGTLYGICF